MLSFTLGLALISFSMTSATVEGGPSRDYIAWISCGMLWPAHHTPLLYCTTPPLPCHASLPADCNSNASLAHFHRARASPLPFLCKRPYESANGIKAHASGNKTFDSHRSGSKHAFPRNPFPIKGVKAATVVLLTSPGLTSSTTGIIYNGMGITRYLFLCTPTFHLFMTVDSCSSFFFPFSIPIQCRNALVTSVFG